MLRWKITLGIALCIVHFHSPDVRSEENQTYGSIALKSGSKLTGWIEATADGALRVTTDSGVILIRKESIDEIRYSEPPKPSDKAAGEINTQKQETDKTYPIARTEEDLVECFKSGKKVVFYQGDYAYLMPDGLYYRNTEAYDLVMHLLHQHLVRFKPIYSAEGITEIPEVENWRELRRHWEAKTPVVNLRGAQAFYMSNNRYYWSQDDFNFGLYEFARLKLPEEYFDAKVYPIHYFFEKPKNTSEVVRLAELVRTELERQVARELVESTHSDHWLNVYLTTLSEQDHIRFEEEREARKIRSDIENRAPIRHSIFVIGKYVKEFRNSRRGR